MHLSGNVISRAVGAWALTGSLGLLLAIPSTGWAALGLGTCRPDVEPITLAQAPASTAPLSAATASPFGLKFDPALNLEPAKSGDTPVYIFGQTISGQTEDLLESRGDAEFRKLGVFIKGDYIRHDLVQDELYAEGQVKLFREGEFYEGPKLKLKLGTTQGFFENVTYQLTSTGGRGSAAHAEFIQPLETKLTQATFTTCSRDRPAWELRMDELLVDQIREVGQTQSSYLYWGDTPVLPMGDLSFAISDRRKTGFLAPSYATTSRLGLEISTPFYWNIAPEHDMTLSPRLISRRGVQLGSEFRFLRQNSLGTINYEVLPNDQVTGETRQFGAITTTTRLGSNMSLSLNAARASDDSYFSDFGTSLLGASQRILPATLALNSAWSGWNFQAQAQEYQLLQDVASPLIKPYSTLPRLTASRAHAATLGRDALPVDWNLNAEMTAFRHPTLAEGERYVASGSAAYRHFYQGFYLTPKVSLHATHYTQSFDGDSAATAEKYNNASLGIYSNNVDGLSQSYDRVLPTFSLDASTVLERNLTLRGLPMEQTLEPRLVYIYTPYKDQSLYPVFDTGSPSLNFAQIFSDAAFNGPDRIADLNQLTAGVTTRFIEEQSGIERFRAALGQRFYFSDQRVSLPGETVRSDRESDLLGQISTRLQKSWSVDALAQYTRATDTWQNASLVTQYSPKAASTVSAAYRFVRGSSNTIDLAFQWPIARHWYAVGRYQHSLKDLGDTENQQTGLVEALLGVEYDGGCWVGRVVAQQFVTSSVEKNTAVFFQIELNGVARVGTNPLAALTRSIPNYQMINQMSPLPAKFDNFQ
jgi:LPS-assembly protein